MKQGFYQIMSLVVVGTLLLAGCNAGQNNASTPPAVTRSQSSGQTGATRSPVVAGSNPTRERPTSASPTATATPIPATPTATEIPATATPPTIPTPTVGAYGRLAIPNQHQTIDLSNSTSSYAVSVKLPDQVLTAYQFSATAGQILYATVNGNTIIQVFSPSNNPLTQMLQMPGMFNIELPETGNYIFVLQGSGQTTVGLYLASASDQPQTGAPIPEKPQAMKVPTKPLSVSIDVKLDPAAPNGYTFNAQGGQTLTLNMRGDVTPVVIAPDGNTLVPAPNPFDGLWYFSMIEDGQYTLVLSGNGLVLVTLQLTSLGTATPAPTVQAGSPVRITFPAGDASVNLSTTFVAGQPQTFVINLQAGQAVIVNLTGNAAVTQMTGPDSKPVNVVHSQYFANWSAQTNTAGDYTFVLAGSGPSVISFNVPYTGQVP